MNLNSKHIESLLEKYFEGNTSLREEQELRSFFHQKYIPNALKQYKPIFEFFSLEMDELSSVQQRSDVLPETSMVLKKNSINLWKWVNIAVAACLLLFAGIKSEFWKTQPDLAQSSVYVNGVKYTDLQTIQYEVLNTLDNFSGIEADVVSSQIDMLNDFLVE